MLPSPRLRPVTARQAAALLSKAVRTIKSWAVRYGARKLGVVDGAIYYDLTDLMIIEREIRRGRPVPATPEDRAALDDYAWAA